MAKILIAEDERDIRDLIEILLTYAGHQVTKATDGQEAVELAPTVMPDLIMMDVRMPRMTGYQACLALKQIEAVRSIPVVFLSAMGQEAEIELGIDAGAYEYILKPFAPDELATRVTEILKKVQQAPASVTPSPSPSLAQPAAPVPPDPSAPSVVPGQPGKTPSESVAADAAGAAGAAHTPNPPATPGGPDNQADRA